MYLPDGSLQVTQLVNFDRTQWTLECAMFMDFTTQIPETNDVPVWSSTAPVNGTRIATGGTGTTVFTPADVGNAWASDDDGWSLDCTFAEEGWSVSTNVLGDFLVAQPATSSISEATCTIVDPLGATDENDSRTWTFGTLFTATGTVDDDGENARLTITSSGLANEFIFTPRALQGGQLGGVNDAVTVSSSAPSTIAVSLSNIRPGSFTITGLAEATNMIDFTVDMDLNLAKPNSPPVITVAVNFDGENATWDDNQQKFELYGLVNDPDLEGVSMSLTICGAEYQGFVIDNINWNVEVSTAICMANGLTDYDVVITATDDSGASTQLTVEVQDPMFNDAPVPVNPVTGEPDSSLPFPSFLATLAMLGAALILRRRSEE
jgi:hypothetical protein